MDISKEVPLYVKVLCEKRKELMDFLASKNIETRPFHPNLSSAAYLKNTDNFPNSDIFFKKGIFLPSGPTQSLENIDKVIDTLKLFKKND